jgi:hypothetical protein
MGGVLTCLNPASCVQGRPCRNRCQAGVEVVELLLPTSWRSIGVLLDVQGIVQVAEMLICN